MVAAWGAGDHLRRWRRWVVICRWGPFPGLVSSQKDRRFAGYWVVAWVAGGCPSRRGTGDAGGLRLGLRAARGLLRDGVQGPLRRLVLLPGLDPEQGVRGGGPDAARAVLL